MPMLGFLYENPVLSGTMISGGQCRASLWAEGVLPSCKERMPQGKRIGHYRGDSASYQAGLFNQLEKDGMKYGITADQDKAVKSAIALIPSGDWKEPVKGCGHELAEAVHCMNGTKKAFRLVVKREIRRQGDFFEREGQYFYHAVRRTG